MRRWESASPSGASEKKWNIIFILKSESFFFHYEDASWASCIPLGLFLYICLACVIAALDTHMCVCVCVCVCCWINCPSCDSPPGESVYKWRIFFSCNLRFSRVRKEEYSWMKWLSSDGTNKNKQTNKKINSRRRNWRTQVDFVQRRTLEIREVELGLRRPLRLKGFRPPQELRWDPQLRLLKHPQQTGNFRTEVVYSQRSKAGISPVPKLCWWWFKS